MSAPPGRSPTRSATPGRPTGGTRRDGEVHEPGSGAQTTGRAIAGTDEDLLFRTAGSNPVSYRFDALPAGTYEVDLRFAETDARRPGRRSTDVYLDDLLVRSSHDIAGEVGPYTADRHTLFVEVTDGRLDVQFVPSPASGRRSSTRRGSPTDPTGEPLLGWIWAR